MPESDSSSGGQPARRSGFSMFWTTLPGILTGIAAVITASVGLITMLNRSGRERGATSGDRPAATISAPASSAPAATPNAPPEGVFAQGRIAMRSPERADLERGLSSTAEGDGVDFYLYCTGIECLLNTLTSLVSATNGPSDRASCARALETRRENVLRLEALRKGQILCVQTGEGHIGSLTIVGLPGVGSNEFVFDYTLYR